MPATRTRATLFAAIFITILAACGGPATSPSPTADASATPMPTATPIATESAPASAGPSGSDGSPGATDGGETAFTCDLPITDPGTAPIANVVDVRVGTHDGYDRLVLEFEQGTPAFSLERAESPFVQDGSGMPVDVDGESFLGLVMRGGTKQTDEGTSSYEGSTDFSSGFPQLIHAVEIGDFERQSTWILGLAEEACVRVQTLDEPPRLVIDVEH